MTSDAAKARRKANRAAARNSQQSQPEQPDQPDVVDGKQVTAADPQVQKTAQHGHGEQSQRGNCSEPQQTAHLRLENESGRLATKMLKPIPARERSGTAHTQTIPGAVAHVESFGLQYSLQARGLSEIQIRRACEKAWLETFHEMQIVLDYQYEPEIVALFNDTVKQKAVRIAESKRRRCARTNRQPKPSNQNASSTS